MEEAALALLMHTHTHTCVCVRVCVLAGDCAKNIKLVHFIHTDLVTIV